MRTNGRAAEIEKTLKKCRKQIFYIKALEEMRAEVFAQMASVKGMEYEKPRVSSSDISDLGAKVEAAYERLQELDAKVAAAIAEQAELRLAALDLINHCDNAVQMAVLTDYYIHGYSWEKVAERLNYTDWAVYKIRLSALAAIERSNN